VTRNGRDLTVMVSPEECRRLKRPDRQVFAVGELPEDIAAAVSRAEMDSRHKHLDELIKDWIPRVRQRPN
jgi:hypothetical protein